MEDLDIQLLELFTLIDEVDKRYMDESSEGDSSNISYEYNEDEKKLLIEFGWASYEECSCTTIGCKIFPDHIEVIETTSGNSCFGGDYQNENETRYSEIRELTKYLYEILN